MTKILEGETHAQAMKRELLDRVERLGGVSAAMKSNVVRITEAKTQYQAFEMAGRIAKVQGAPVYWVKSEYLPDAVKEVLIKNQGKHLSEVQVAVAYPPVAGQAGGGGENVSLIVLPWWSHENDHAVEVEVGCIHEIKGTNLGNCYNRYECVKCGYMYEVDSSD